MLVWMFGGKAIENTKRGFEEMNLALKKRAEEK
jgi:hypothetical protein